MQFHDFLNTHVIFRLDEFKQLMESREQGMTEKNCMMTLYRYCKKGRLLHVRKGLYVVANPSVYQAADISPFLIAGKATEGSILAYHTALESHGISYTDFNEHTYIAPQRSQDFDFQNQHYRSFISQNFFHIETVLLFGIEIKRTTLERTIVDVLDRPEVSGGWEEVMRSLDHVTVFNTEMAVDYALSLGRASAVAKLGYFLEQRPDYLQTDQKILKRLLPHIPKNPYYIDRKSSSKGLGTYIKKWEIIVPTYLHQRQWEEPEHDIDY